MKQQTNERTNEWMKKLVTNYIILKLFTEWKGRKPHYGGALFYIFHSEFIMAISETALL